MRAMGAAITQTGFSLRACAAGGVGPGDFGRDDTGAGNMGCGDTVWPSPYLKVQSIVIPIVT